MVSKACTYKYTGADVGGEVGVVVVAIWLVGGKRGCMITAGRPVFKTTTTPLVAVVACKKGVGRE